MRRRTRRPAVLHLRKLKAGPGTNVPSLSRARLMQLIEEAVLDAYTEEEQVAGFLTMIEEHLALPFSVKILGVDADVEKVDLTLAWIYTSSHSPKFLGAYGSFFPTPCRIYLMY